MYPEWNIAALSHVPDDVSKEVQAAMLAIAEHGMIDKRYIGCLERYNSTDEENESYCSNPERFPSDYTETGNADDARCDTTPHIAKLAVQAMSKGKYSAFTSTLSYMSLRNMQQEIGFIEPSEDDMGKWHCLRSNELYDSVVCPKGQIKKSKADFETSCELQGLSCNIDEDYECICQPCYVPKETCINNAVRIHGKCVRLRIILPCTILPIAIITVGVLYYIIKSKSRQLERQKILTAQNDAIVSSLFPIQIRDRLLKMNGLVGNGGGGGGGGTYNNNVPSSPTATMSTTSTLAGNLAMSPSHLLKNFLSGDNTTTSGRRASIVDDGNEHMNMMDDKPLADFFPR